MKNLSAKAKAIYDLLRNRPTAQDENGTYCIYPIKELAMDCAVNEKTVRRSLKELEDKKYIFCHTQRRQAQRIYFVHSNSENVHSNSENVHSKKMSTQTPKMSTQTPKMSTQTPKMSTQTPKMSTHSLKMSTHSLKMSTHSLKMSPHLPKLSPPTPKLSPPSPKMNTPFLKMSTQTTYKPCKREIQSHYLCWI